MRSRAACERTAYRKRRRVALCETAVAASPDSAKLRNLVGSLLFAGRFEPEEQLFPFVMFA
jgi:hypothetical protein